MLERWGYALEQFPASSVVPGIRSLTVYPFHWGETPVLEQSFWDGASAREAVRLASEFLHDDYAYEAQLHWDLWTSRSGSAGDGWQRIPQTVSVACVGTGFNLEEEQDRGNLELNLGPDSAFLPSDEPSDEQDMSESFLPDPSGPARENIEKLMSYLQRLERRLPISRRLLWSESGEDLGEKFGQAWNLDS